MNISNVAASTLGAAKSGLKTLAATNVANVTQQSPGALAFRAALTQAKTNLDAAKTPSLDTTSFRSPFDKSMKVNAAPKESGIRKPSLSDKIMVRATNLASEVQKDQQNVSNMLEQAARKGDSVGLMKAMIALNDYQMRIQFVAKTVSKATSSVDQLTKLQ